MDVLLSIKPEYAEKILDNRKRYEFRKTRFREPAAVDRIFLYASTPVQMIVGMFTPAGVIADSPERLWNRFCDQSGIDSYEHFADYFDNSEIGYAIEIDDATRFDDSIDPWAQVDDFRPPVSFQYLDGELRSLLDTL